MNWVSYKALCDRPDYWSEWMLQQCADLFAQLGEQRLVDKTVDALSKSPLPLPAGHKGGPSTFMHQLSWPGAERVLALTAIKQAAAAGLTTSATTTRGLSGFEAAWQEYVDYPH